MQYRFAENQNYEDLSCGSVIYHKTGFTNYPVRLACEIFLRCLEFMGQPEKRICVYDPCCGGGYLLTVLGFLYNNRIDSIYGSDISEMAVCIAASNLGLLTSEGLARRKDQLINTYNEHGKESHHQAIQSADRLAMMIRDRVKSHAFVRDILALNEPSILSPLADIIITDVPYGNLVSWSADDPFAMDKMLDNLLGNLKDTGVLAISSDKRQKINNPHYKRLKKFQAGKRKVEFFTKEEQ